LYIAVSSFILLVFSLESLVTATLSGVLSQLTYNIGSKSADTKRMYSILLIWSSDEYWKMNIGI